MKNKEFNIGDFVKYVFVINPNDTPKWRYGLIHSIDSTYYTDTHDACYRIDGFDGKNYTRLSEFIEFVPMLEWIESMKKL